MELINIVQEKDNPLFNRKEVKILVESDSTPSEQDSKKIISEKFSKPEENIIIKKINGKFGRKTFLIISFVYSTLEDKNKTEPKQKKKENK